tara:strand:- start:717 stop:1130 length:414 start_codon:yes stop_codon:yes gene_type:complete
LFKALIYSIYYAKRWRKDRAALQERVEAADGEVERFQQPGMFLRAPFPPLGNHSLYFKLHVRHADRRGVWYVRTTLDAPKGTWVWKDAAESSDLPVDWPDARVDNSILEMGVLPALLVYLGVIGGFVFFIFWAYGFK